MSHLVSVESNGRLIDVRISERMDRAGYDHIVPYLDRAIDEFDSVRLLVDLSDYFGREDGAEFESAEFDLPHWANIERVAIVGDEKYEANVPWFCRPFTSAEVRFYRPGLRQTAEEWIHDGL